MTFFLCPSRWFGGLCPRTGDLERSPCHHAASQGKESILGTPQPAHPRFFWPRGFWTTLTYLTWLVATQIFFNFHPEPWGNDPILTNIFEMGWFNHHLVTKALFVGGLGIGPTCSCEVFVRNTFPKPWQIQFSTRLAHSSIGWNNSTYRGFPKTTGKWIYNVTYSGSFHYASQSMACVE